MSFIKKLVSSIANLSDWLTSCVASDGSTSSERDADAEMKIVNKQKVIRNMLSGKEEENYNMKSESKSPCLIFNFTKFTNQKQLPETDIDRGLLENTFKNLNFKVESYKNKTLKKTKSILQEESKRDHTDKDCLVICFLSHGDEKNLCCKDEMLKRQELLEFFDAEKCPSLVGKPVILIIDACFGLKKNNGISKDIENDTPKATATVPPDTFVFNSTTYGYVSYSEKGGSPFIRLLCQVLDEYSDRLDLQSMASSVKNAFNEFKQMPSFTSNLTRPLYFKEF